MLARRGVVVTAHPLASAAGLKVLQDGGNAMDAAIAAAGVMGVVQPMMSGLGGDTFLLYYDEERRKVWALNGSGAAPTGATRQFFVSRGHTTMPLRGMLSVSVPGAVGAMVTALERWGSGRLSLAQLLEPAIGYAEEGAPLAPAIGDWVRQSAPLFEDFPTTATVFAPDGHVLGPGDMLVQRDLARSLRLVAEGGRDAFYEGSLARQIVDFSGKHDGLLTLEDFRRHASEVTEPIATTYRGLTVLTTPPPSQGIILLMMLNILAGFPGEMFRWGEVDGIHAAVEAKKRAFADRLAHLGDPRFVDNPLERLLSMEHGEEHRQAILGGMPFAGSAAGADGDTTYLCVADADGNLVSWITSLSARFGCGEIVEGTGILLNNRAGRGFELVEGHPNVIAPGKRTMHTLMAFMAVLGDRPRYVFGTPGGDSQPQINLQVLLNLVESGMDVQQAIDAPRWISTPGTDPAHVREPLELGLEDGFPEGTAEALRARGHRIGPARTESQGEQVIVVEGDYYRAGSDARVDGLAIGY